LAALDNALALGYAEDEAVKSNVLVLPPDLAQSYSLFLLYDPLLGTVY
jgi:hypothetical protein